MPEPSVLTWFLFTFAVLGFAMTGVWMVFDEKQRTTSSDKDAFAACLGLVIGAVTLVWVVLRLKGGL